MLQPEPVLLELTGQVFHRRTGLISIYILLQRCYFFFLNVIICISINFREHILWFLFSLSLNLTKSGLFVYLFLFQSVKIS